MEYHFFPDEVRESLPPLYSQDGKGLEALALVKFFSPDSNWTWWATEFDPDQSIFFGLVEGFEKELGYFTLEQIEEARGPYGLPIERDIWFEPKPLSSLME